ncbi:MULTISPECIES: fimbria/pilus outer membrane usher protein [Acinetobacter]|uniref:fimbria/pilus outer membrane usher protein n=1 Tax=Acinetobacter TaxID=469 RepID=UPI0014457809|nr:MULTISPECIES: fimbria/pilus outer membrane usher protein [Acinetobacter]MEB6565423.1 fimbria/pilus outer membrane usher protein [Acinetobacter towneri]
MFKKSISAMLAIYLSSLYIPYTHANEKLNEQADESIWGLWINGVDQHKDIILTVMHNNKYIECSSLNTDIFDISKFEKFDDNSKLCLLDAKNIIIDSDEDAQIIKLNIGSMYMKNQYINNINNGKQPQLPGLGGFIDYELFSEKSKNFQRSSAMTDFGIFWRNALLTHTHLFENYSNHTENDKFTQTRLSTNITFEFPKKFTSLQLGDAVSPYSGVGQPYYFGGVKWGTNYSSRQDFVYWNTPALRGSALVPSSVDLIINGNKVYNTTVNPGEFLIDSGINFNGMGNAELVVQDVLGNRTVQTISIFVNERLLKKGLSNYSIATGKLRYNYSEESDDYRDWFVSGYLRRGVTEKLSLGGVIDYSRDLSSVGMLWTQYLNSIGLFELNSVFSDSSFGQGYSVSTEFKRDQGLYSIGLRSQHYSPEYRMLGMDGQNNTYLPKQENIAYVARTALPILGNVSLNYIEKKYHNHAEVDDQKILNIRASRTLFDDLNMSLSYVHDMSQAEDHRVDLALSYRFSPKHTAYLTQNHTDSSYLSLIKDTPASTGFNYSVGTGYLYDLNEFSGHVNGHLKTQIGDLNLQYLQTGQTESYQFAMNGAVTWLDRSVALTRSVDHGFSLVKVANSPNIDVYRNDIFVGKTNQKGEIFVNDLIAYSDQHLSFDQNQLNIEDQITDARKTIMPLNKRGYVVEFPVIQTKAISIELRDRAGAKLPKGSQIILNGNADEIYVIGSKDTATLYGVKNGKQHLKVSTSATQSCQVEFEITDIHQVNTPISLICK